MLNTLRSLFTLLVSLTLLTHHHHVDAGEIQKRRASEEILYIRLPERREQLTRSPSLPLPLRPSPISEKAPTRQVVGAPVLDYFDPRIASITPDEMRGLGVHKDQFSYRDYRADAYRLRRRCSDGDILMSKKSSHRFSRSLDNASPITKKACPLCGDVFTTVSALQDHLEVHK